MNIIATTPLISIVIATYNGERFLRKQLDSIVNQSYQNIEIIAVDDCSSDNTLNILNEYAERYNNFIIVSNDHNLGYIKNFEKGFLLASGDYIAPSDQDDIWLVDKIETLLHSINGHAIAYCNSAFIDSNDELIGDKLSDKTTFTDFDNPLMYVVGASAPSHAMLLTRQVALDAMPFPLLFSHDNWLGFVATFHSSVKFVNQVLVYYRRHDTNVFSTIHKKKKLKESKQQRIEKAKQRLNLIYDKCPSYLPEKKVLSQLVKSYQSYSLNNNLLRMYLFFRYRDIILRYKKHNSLRRFLYCIKVFFKII
jgi:glycosyltransferase involved in cell wall biosynthesis